MWGSHFSGLFNAALESPLVHHCEHMLYLAAALLFWWPVLGVARDPRRLSFPARGVYLFLAMPQNTFLSLAIFSAKAVRYPHYATVTRTWGASALSDQHTAGGIMWVSGDLIFLVGLIIMMAMWARHEERMASIIDAQLDAQSAAAQAAQEGVTRRATAMETKSSPK
jgi:putative copper resistance protein D